MVSSIKRLNDEEQRNCVLGPRIGKVWKLLLMGAGIPKSCIYEIQGGESAKDGVQWVRGITHLAYRDQEVSEPLIVLAVEQFVMPVL